LRVDSKTAACLVALGASCWLASSPAAAQDEPNEALIEMVVDLISDADRDMRALGLQQIREEVPGEAATKKFAGLLPELSPQAQADLLGALGDRGDAAAKPAVLAMLESEQAAVRAAALSALGALGGAGDVPLLAKNVAAGSNAEEAAARLALVRLRGEEVNQAVLSAMDEAGAETRAALLGVLAARNAKEALPEVVESTQDESEAVRLAALSALRYLAGIADTARLVDVLGKVQSEAERRKAELALLAVCSRGGEDCAGPLLDALGTAKPAARIALLHALARAGGPDAYDAVRKIALNEEAEERVRDEAVRMLSRWPDPKAVADLHTLAGTAQNRRYKVLAIRGLVRLAAEAEPPQVDMLAEALDLAPRPEEKRLVLGALGNVGTAEALSLVTPLLSDAAVAEEAALATIAIAARIKEEAADQAREALNKVLTGPASQAAREGAQKVLDSI